MSKNLESDEEVLIYAQSSVEDPKSTAPIVIPAQATDALHLYMNFIPIAVISRETGLPVPVISKMVYAKGGWKEQRDKLNSDVVESVRQKSLKRLQKANQIGIRLIIKGLQAFEKRIEGRDDRAPTLEETEVLTDIHAKIHKAKLSEEDPEAEKKIMGITPKQILEAINGDPYLKKALAANASEKEEIELMEQADGVYESADSRSLANPE